jgi:hypothetical protein
MRFTSSGSESTVGPITVESGSYPVTTERDLDTP